MQKIILIYVMYRLRKRRKAKNSGKRRLRHWRKKSQRKQRKNLTRIDSIAKDMTVDQSSGSAYYMVKVKCDSVTVQNKEGKTGTVMNGMACQAKVVVEEENVLHDLLKKIDLID